MSFLFKFIDSGFLLTLGLVLLVSGGIMLYCYRRLNLLEKSLIEHGKILQNFIINYNMQMQQFSLANNSIYNNKNTDATNNDEIIKTEYVEFDKVKKINLGEKIPVSDDEDEDDDEDGDEDEDSDKDSDEDSDKDSDEDSDEDEDKDSDEDVSEDEKMDTLAISNNNLEEDLEELENVESIATLENITLHEESISTFDDETFLKNLPINLNSFTLENTNNNPKIINLENNTNSDTNPGERKNYSKMKVDDLKSLVVTRNLTDNETAQKMKKSDLVKLLQN